MIAHKQSLALHDQMKKQHYEGAEGVLSCLGRSLYSIFVQHVRRRGICLIAIYLPYTNLKVPYDCLII